MQNNIAVLLPYKDQFIKDNAGSASIWVKDFSKDMPFFYGLFSIMFAVFLGIGAAFVRRAISKFRKKYFMKPAK